MGQRGAGTKEQRSSSRSPDNEIQSLMGHGEGIPRRVEVWEIRGGEGMSRIARLTKDRRKGRELVLVFGVGTEGGCRILEGTEKTVGI